jgi:hypothetical protein
VQRTKYGEVELVVALALHPLQALIFPVMSPERTPLTPDEEPLGVVLVAGVVVRQGALVALKLLVAAEALQIQRLLTVFL